MSKLPVVVHISQILSLNLQTRYPNPQRMMSTMTPTLAIMAMSMPSDEEHSSSVVAGGSTSVQEFTEEVM